MKKLITAPFNALKRALKRVEYILTIRHKVHTIYILLILLHWIYGYAFITGTQFYEAYTKTAQAAIGRNGGNDIQQDDGRGKKNVITTTPEHAQGTQEWIRQQWEAAGADWNEVWAVVQGESGWNSDAWNCNGKGSSNNPKSKALDIGLYMANSQHEITPSCALNTVCATNWSINLWKEQGWAPWMAAAKLGIK